jgi:2-haloacid dehalogenase
MDASGVKALIFDVFGTVVDWRGSLIDQCRAFGSARGIAADWEAFADAWRARYRPYMDRVRSGQLPWTNLDGLRRMSLEKVLAEFQVTGLAEEEKAEMNSFWRRLRPWPDSVPGLYRLKHRFIIAPMSNGNVAMMPAWPSSPGSPGTASWARSWPGTTSRTRRAT